MIILISHILYICDSITFYEDIAIWLLVSCFIIYFQYKKLEYKDRVKNDKKIR